MKSENKYIMIDRLFLEDPRLSFEAKGVLAYVMSRPNDWEFNVSEVCNVSSEIKESINSAIEELIKFEYLKESKKLV